MAKSTPPGYLRPFAVQSDLAELADLIQVAFGEELRRTGNQMVEEMRRMAAWGPLMSILPSPWAMMRGYVWMQDDHIVGNVTYGRERDRGDWQLSNVSVLPEARGLGISSRLVDEALTQIRANSGRRVYLQVRKDNALARGLYERRGFVVYDTIEELGLRPAGWPLVVGPQAGVQSVHWWQGKQIENLARRALPQGRIGARPHLVARYRRGLWQALDRALVSNLAGPDHEVAVFDNGQALAYGHLGGDSTQRSAEIELLVDPEHRGEWEAALTMALLARQEPDRRHLRAHVSVEHPHISIALQTIGFEVLRTLDEMVLVL